MTKPESIRQDSRASNIKRIIKKKITNNAYN